VNQNEIRREIGRVRERIEDLKTAILITLFEQRDNLPELEQELHELQKRREELFRSIQS